MKLSEHTKISFCKSILRIIGLLFLPEGIWAGVMLLIAAEVVGVTEEFYA
jgi:hypothetical protein